MSVLTQFFGAGGSGIATEVLVVNGGDGAWRASVTSVNPYAPSTRCEVAQGRGGQVSSGFFAIAPGTSCSITVGAGGATDCRGPVGSPTPWCFFNCCVGGSGCASKFGTFGGEPRPQPTTPTVAGIAIPYGVNSLAAFGCPFSTNLMSEQVLLCASAVFQSSYSYCVISTNVRNNMFCSRQTSTAYAGGAYLSYSALLPAGNHTTVCTAGLASLAHHGFVSKITGTVKTYGATKVHGWTYCGNGCSFPNCGLYMMCKSRPHPSAIGTGSGHGAWRCGSSYVNACPGTVVVQYPSDFDAASVSSPSVCDCSPATPGFRTYRFLCPGTIVFP